MDDLNVTDGFLENIRPRTKPKVIDLVKIAGLDVSDWANCKGGLARAAANPGYFYEWCFEQEGLFVFNIWFEKMMVENGCVPQRRNLRMRPTDISGSRKRRAHRFDNAVRAAFERRSHPRVIVLVREEGKRRARARMLDRAPWTITNYDDHSGDFEMRRGICDPLTSTNVDAKAEQFPEGEFRWRCIRHRHREAKLRPQKIDVHKAKDNGRLLCAIEGCGFDFEACYGPLGAGYAQVHHLQTLSKADESGVSNTIDNVRVVCANCQVMIHRGGACRDPNDLAIRRDRHV